MKILVEGDPKRLNKVKVFDCDKCGCRFEADYTEYERGSQYNEEYIFASCPYCGQKVYRGA